MSACDTSLASPIRPLFIPKRDLAESPIVQQLIRKLGLQTHPEGGYFLETDRDTGRVPNPFQKSGQKGGEDLTRSASTTIFYLITPGNPKGVFHVNKARTVHTLHRGRGRYVLIHVDEKERGKNARIETFIVGQDVHVGERLQWIVEGGVYKASYLLPDTEGTRESEGLLISEVSKAPVQTVFNLYLD